MIVAAMAGTTYYIEGPLLPWLWPALDLAGLAIQLLAAITRIKWLVWPGFILICAGCFPERDLTLAVGDAVASLALFYILRKP